MVEIRPLNAIVYNQEVVDINEKPHLLTHDDLISVKTSQPMLIKIKQQLNQRIKATNQQINKVKKEEANNETYLTIMRDFIGNIRNTTLG